MFINSSFKIHYCHLSILPCDFINAVAGIVCPSIRRIGTGRCSIKMVMYKWLTRSDIDLSRGGNANDLQDNSLISSFFHMGLLLSWCSS